MTHAAPELHTIQAERCRRSFRTFVEQAWPVIEPTRLRRPGTIARLPFSAASTAALATSSADIQTKPGVLSSACSNPAACVNSVLTGPGQTAVRVTPVPLSSSWTASLRLSTNAFVAA